MCKGALTISCPLARAAQAHPGAVAFRDGEGYTYDVFNAMVSRYQTALEARGIRQGDRVVLAGAPSVRYAAAFWAVTRASAIACPVNPAMPQDAMAGIRALLRPRCVLGSAHGTGEENAPQAPDFTFDELHQAALATAPATVTADSTGDTPATIILTSGSSGQPKAAAHSLNNHVASARAANANMPLHPGDVWLLSLPLFHVSGLAVLFRCALAGAAVAIPAQEHPLEEQLPRSDATHVSLVPTQLQRLLDTAQGVSALRTLKGVLLGGAPTSDALIKRACALGVPLVRSYGMTETSAQLCATAPGAPLEDLYSSGRALTPGTVRIGDGNMIEVRGPSVFLGYWNTAGKIHRPETGEGWFCTGDTGRLDDTGRLHVIGRADAMFISGGENIYPEEIEAALKAIPGVEQAVVVDVPHCEFGRAPVAFVRMADAMPPSAEDLRGALMKTLPRYKIPRRYFPWPEDIPPGDKFDRAFFRAAADEGERP